MTHLTKEFQKYQRERIKQKLDQDILLLILLAGWQKFLIFSNTKYVSLEVFLSQKTLTTKVGYRR